MRLGADSALIGSGFVVHLTALGRTIFRVWKRRKVDVDIEVHVARVVWVALFIVRRLLRAGLVICFLCDVLLLPFFVSREGPRSRVFICGRVVVRGRKGDREW